MPLREELPVIRLAGLEPDKRACKFLPETAARSHSIAPLWLESDRLLVACTKPSDKELIHHAESAGRRPVRAFQASYPEIRDALDQTFNGKTNHGVARDLGGILYLLGYLSSTELSKIRSEQKSSGRSILSICRERGSLNERDLAEGLSIYCRVPFFDLYGLVLDHALTPLIPWKMATEKKILPIWWIASILVLATPEMVPEDHFRDIANFLNTPVQPVICRLSDWEKLYRNFYLRGTDDPDQQDLQIVRTLIRQRVISELDMTNAQAVSLQSERPLPDVLLDNKLISAAQWLNALSTVSGISIGYDGKNPPENGTGLLNMFQLLPRAIAEKFIVYPLSLEKTKLRLGVARPDQAVIRLIEKITGYEIEPCLLSRQDIEQKFKELDPTPGARKPILMPGLGELLLKLGIVSNAQADEIRLEKPGEDQTLSEGLIRGNYLDELDLVEVLGLQTALPHTSLDHVRIDKKYLSLIPETLAHEHSMLPLWANGSDMWVAIADPFDADAFRQAEVITGMRIRPVLAPRPVIKATLDRWLNRRQTAAMDPRVLTLLQSLVSAGVITQVNATAALQSYNLGNIALDQAIVDASLLPRSEIARAIAVFNKLPFVSLQLEERRVTRIDPLGRETERTIHSEPVQEQVVTLLTLEQARQFSAIPIREDGAHVTIGFANPIYQDDLAQIQNLLQREINPVIVNREEWDEALQRLLGKRNLGTYLLMDGLISRGQLNQALDIARRTGVRLGQALINRGFITDEQLYRYLAKQSSLPLYDLKTIQIDKNLATSIPHAFARENGVLPILDSAGEITLAIVDPFNRSGVDQMRIRLRRLIHPVLVTETDFDAALEILFRGQYLTQSTSELLDRAPQDSAYRVLSKAQVISFLIMALGSLLWILLDFNSFIILINALATIFYVGFSGYKFYLVYRALAFNMELPVSQDEVRGMDERELPVYTLLIPAYKEAQVLPELLSALNRLDYPATKLDIQVLMEQEDKATIQAYDEWQPPSHFHRVIVPYGIPMTKPKACNYGLMHARGEYVVIYDAEDLPEPDQLKKTVLAFSKAPADVACIQSKLNYFNSEQNILTQWFTVEYSMWFDLFLPGLSATNAPIPLGGTSNHFKKSVLVEIGAWDPYNVTEDADLGIRLYKRGYKTAIVDSTTYEEATSRVYNWLRQRSRWIKGYIQTWLVHMRSPVKLVREIGFKAFLSFHLVVGGTFFAALLNPIYWLLTTLWFMVHWNFIQVLYPGVIYFLGALALFIGNFAFTYMNVAGALRREYYGMVKYALLSPLYWALASIGAWMGLIQLLYRPHFWEKTNHGFHSEGTKVLNGSDTAPLGGSVNGSL